MNHIQRELTRSAIRALSYRAASRVPPGLAIAILIGIFLLSLAMGAR